MISGLEAENYLVISGRGEITVGAETKEVDASKEQVLINIPGSVPHQTWNPYPEPLIIFYFFPEGGNFKENIHYYFPHTDFKTEY